MISAADVAMIEFYEDLDEIRSLPFVPLTAPEMPIPGPHFRTMADGMSNARIITEGKGKAERLVQSTLNLNDLYRRGTYELGFQLPVKLKGNQRLTSFIPGHRWGSDSIMGPVPASVMILGKWPGRDEATCQRNLVGASGKILMRALEECGLAKSEYDSWYVTNLCKHLNVDPSSNRLPAAWIKDQLPILQQELRIVRPNYILCLGTEASKVLLGSDVGGVTTTQGRVFELKVPLHKSDDEEPAYHSIKVMTSTHSAAVARTPDMYSDFLNGIESFVELIRGSQVLGVVPDLDWEDIYTERHLKQVVDKILAETDPKLRDWIAIDCEWHGEYPTELGSWLRTIQFCANPEKAYNVVLRHRGGAQAFCPSMDAAVRELTRLLVDTEDRKVRLIGHNLRADLPWVRHCLDEKLGERLIEQFTAPPDDPGAAEGNGKFGWEKFRTEGGFDTMLACHSVQEVPGPSGYKLEICAGQYAGIPRWDFELREWIKKHKKKLQELKKKKKKAELFADSEEEEGPGPKDEDEDNLLDVLIDEDEMRGFGDVPDAILLGQKATIDFDGEVLEKHVPYAAWDVAGTRRLMERLNDDYLDSDRYGLNSWKPFWITMRASPACLEMEMTGMPMDRDRAEKLTMLYMNKRDKLVQELRTLVAWPKFNPNSHYHSRELLFGPQFSGKRDKTTNEVVSVGPEDGKGYSCHLKPLTTAGKPKREWDEVVRRGEQAFYNPSTDKEVLGILLANLPRDLQRDKMNYKVVDLLRSVRFIGQVLKGPLRAPLRDEVTNDILLDEDSHMQFSGGLLSFEHIDGRIRTHLFQTKETGRYSSARPPLQNLSKRRESEYASILGEDYMWPLRSMFRASEGCVIIEADYIGAELYMMALQGRIKKMIDHCQRAELPDNDPRKYDIHSNMAVQAFRLTIPEFGVIEAWAKKEAAKRDSTVEKVLTKLGMTAEEIKARCGEPLIATKTWLKAAGKSNLRDVAKTIMFGIPYGRGDAAVIRAVEEMGVKISLDDAALVRQTIFENYPGLEDYFISCHKRVESPGHMTNCYGRRRRFPQALDDKIRSEQERQAGNFPIQGGVADLVSTALDLLYYHPERRDARGHLRYKMVLQLHDAVYFEVPIPELQWFLGTDGNPGVLQNCMSGVPVWACDHDGIPYPGEDPHFLPIDYSVHFNWGESINKEHGLAAGIPEEYL